MKLNRRILLRGMFQGSAAMMALPFLDCFLDGNGRALAATGAKIPTRFGTYFWGCSLTRELRPKTFGLNYEDTLQMEPLKPLKSKFNLLTGFRVYLDEKPSFMHWTGQAGIGSGVAPTNQGEFDAQTIDQTIADNIAHGTRFRSISVAASGNKSESFSSLGGANNITPDVSPRDLYGRLFGAGFQDPLKSDWKPDQEVMMQQSVLSVVADDRKRLMASVGSTDKARLDQYFTSVRDLENTMTAELQRPEIVAQVSIPGDPGELLVNKSVLVMKKNIPVFANLLAIGLATNQTRVFNLSVSEGGNTLFIPGFGMEMHQSTHEELTDPKLGYQARVAEYGTYCMEYYAQLLTALDNIKEGDGTLLDHSLVMAYTDVANPKVHTCDDMTLLLGGGASGRIKTGYHIAGDSTTTSRVGLTCQQALGLPVDHWGSQSNLTNKPLSEIMA